MTTDWSKQAQDMSASWLEGQRAAWEQWTRAMGGVGMPMAGASAPNAAWERMLAAWRESVEGALSLQAGWVERWSEMGDQVESPEAAEAWVRQGGDMMNQWLDAQRQLWDAFFSAAATMGPARPADPGAEFTAAWQDAATRMADMQAEWMSTWGPVGGGQAAASGDKKDASA